MRSFCFLIVVFTSNFLLAQEKGVIEFKEGTYDFGQVKEEDGPINHEFQFVNNGSAPIVISNVKASCGCTTPDWSKEPVLPGETGFVQAQYNPRNRPGAFKKSLTITSNASSPSTIIYIQGNVIPRMKTVEEELRIKVGALRMKNKTVNMGRMTTEKSKVRSIDVYNDSDVAFSFTGKYEGPDFIRLSYNPETLQPRQKGKLEVEYDPDFDDNLGFQNHGIKFFTSEEEKPEKELNIMATITEYFPPMSAEEKEKAPRLHLDKRLFDFGKMPQNAIKETTFELTNHGRSDLNIRKVVSNCACVVATVSEMNIEPGQSAVLTAKFDTKGRRGNQIKSVTVYSNDPTNSTQLISIKGQVETSVQ